MPRIFLFCIAAVLLVGCSSVRVTQDYDRDTTFERYQSFAWASPSHPETGDPRLDNPLLHERIQKAIESTLTERGYRMVEPDEADLLIRYQTAVRSRLEHQRSGVTIGSGWYTGRAGMGVALDFPYGSREYDEGTLIIDFLEPGSNALVWRGTGLRPLEEIAGPDERDEIVRDVVERVLAQYPPGK